MVRTQLQLDEPTYEALRRVAHRRRTSMSSVVREILHEHLHIKASVDYTKLAFIGMGRSGKSDISERHDDYLAEDFL
ncbi:MAG: ribbon-helix-helix domain-containing protein [Armatimonadota bacterium]